MLTQSKYQPDLNGYTRQKSGELPPTPGENENSKIEVSYNTIEEELKAQKNVEIWVRIIFYSSWFVITVLGYFWLAYEVLDIY